MNTMKKIFFATAALLALAACQESLEYKDVVYFTGTEANPTVSLYIEGPQEASFTVTSSDAVSEDVTVNVEIDGSAVTAYNEKYGTSYQMVPAGSYQLNDKSVTIKKGKSVSNAGAVEITSMDDFDAAVTYCIPLKITSTSNNQPVLKVSEHMYLVLKTITNTKAPNLGMQTYYSVPSFMNRSSLSDMGVCTMEIRVYVNGWQNSSPYISSLIGVEENFLLRFGDVSCDKNQLQLAGRGVSITSQTHFDTGKWYHIAIVDDGSNATLYVNGEMDTQVSSSGKSAINLAWDYMDGFHVGRSERGRLLNGYVSEARVWQRALTATEMLNNQCYVDPEKADKLIGYWRFDQEEENLEDASGNTFTGVRDLSGNGYHMKPSGSISEWIDLKCPVVE